MERWTAVIPGVILPPVKTAVSLPDELFEAADRLAKRLGKSRSALHAAALAEYLSRHDPAAVTDAMNAVCDDVAEAGPDPFVTGMARRALERSEW